MSYLIRPILGLTSRAWDRTANLMIPPQALRLERDHKRTVVWIPSPSAMTDVQMHYTLGYEENPAAALRVIPVPRRQRVSPDFAKALKQAGVARLHKPRLIQRLRRTP